jgi:hypothetical protein
MGLEVVDCCRNRLVGQTFVEGSFWLLSALSSVAVHVVGSQMVVVDADGLPSAVLEHQENDRIALDWPSRMAEAHENPVDDPDLDYPLVRHGQAASHAIRTAMPGWAPRLATSLPVMANDAQQKALQEVRRTQSKVERGQGQLEQARIARRESFERARAAGLSLADIGKAANLHRSRVDQILQGK